MRVEPVLTAYDVFSLSVSFTVWEAELRIRRIQIKDRHGLALAKVEPPEAPQFHEVRVDKVPRSRFPLFVEVTDGKGTVHAPETVGPVYPAPTDANYTGGIPLPRLAVDVANDPVIRGLRNTLGVGDLKAKAHDRQQAILLDELGRLRELLALPIIVASVFAAATIILAGVSAARPWALSIPAAVVVALMIAVLRTGRRHGKLSRELEAARGRRAADLVDHDRAVERLIALGIYGRVAKTTNATCGCGGHGRKAENEQQ